MPAFAKKSIELLSTCHPDLQAILNEAIKTVDFCITEGHRGKDEQNKLFELKKSKVKFPNSKHNSSPSLAADIAPCPIDWNDLKRFCIVVFYIKGIAISRGIKLRLGADWNGDFIFNESFVDSPHIELDSKLINNEWVKY